MNDSIQPFCLAVELIDQVEKLDLAAVDRGVELEVERPQRVRADRGHGAGLARLLDTNRIIVLEVPRPDRQLRRQHAQRPV